MGKTLEELVDHELSQSTPRSAEYRLGMLDALRFRLNGFRTTDRYEAGTAHFDAYFAGQERGFSLWRKLQDEPQ